ncbi:metallo-beta-lactamase [Candidatus Termititenax spirochaetophilus]|uniref:Metallo-beta-lactamase n=1 Tax=Candidatus Termititenax spirochaetophilus TaxID=2218522 RepID=A0A388T824_9BACT|nr:metallo-beta-lactamase [Candidatus Termititenax spirochaetophilus]
MRNLREKVFAVGVNDPKRKLFDALIPLPDGTSYNSYLIAGQKTAVIDAVDPPFAAEWLANIKATGYTPEYIVANHAEQDHSGAIVDFVREYPQAKIIANEKCRDLLIDLLHTAPEKFIIIKDKEKLDLGGYTLEFYFAPWVHWPETMFTYLPEEKILFTTDFLGSHYASDDLFVHDEDIIYRAAKRYYAEIMMPFRVNVRKHLELVKNLAPKIIAPSHGQCYNRPEFILSAYADWASENTKDVLILYVSMHDSVKQMAEIIRRELEIKSVTVRVLDLTADDLGEVAMELVDAQAVLLGAPTVLAGAHPAAAYAAFLFNALRPKTKILGIFGSYSWGGKMAEQLAGLITNVKPEILPPFICKGLPNDSDKSKLIDWTKELSAKLG